MKRLVLATALLSTIGLQAQVLNVNNKNGTYLPLDTKNTKEITFNESDKIVTLTTSDGVQHCFYTEKVESLSPQTDKSKKLTYNLTPTVVFDNNDQSNFTEKTEVIPTDESDDNYGDYVENWDAGTETEIVFSEDGVSVNGEKKETTHLTIKSTSSKVVYIVSGKCSNGSLKIYSEKKFQLVLTGLELTNPNGPAINIQTGKTVYFTIADNTTNNLCDGETYNAPVIGEDGEEEDQKGTLFSEGQLIFSGTGTLNVKSYGGHGICSDDYIRIRSGNINILAAAKDGFNTNDIFRVGRMAASAPTITINATGDGIDCGKGNILIEAGNITVNTVDDGMTTSYEEMADATIDPSITIRGGFVRVNTTGEKGMAIKANANYTQTGGIVQTMTEGNGSKGVNCEKDFIFTGGKLTAISEGTISSDSSSTAGIKTTGNCTITDGTINISCTGEGAKAINSDGNVIIDGGTTTLLSIGKNYNAGSDDKKTRAISALGYTQNGGTVLAKSYDKTIYTTADITVTNGTLNAYSSSDYTLSKPAKQTGGWILTKDGKE